MLSVAPSQPVRHPREIALSLLRQSCNRWPTELQPPRDVHPTPWRPLNWSPLADLLRYRGSVLVVTPSNSMLDVLWSWYSFRAVTSIEQVEGLNFGTHGVALPKLQIVSSAQLIQMTFSREKSSKAPYDWVSPGSDLVALWLDSGQKAHEAAQQGVIDVINACERHGVPLWIGCAARWRYGNSHALHHARINEWVESAETFEIGREGGLCARTK